MLPAHVELFGKIVPVKSKSCSLNGSDPEQIDPYFNLYIKTNNSCQANCDFCIYHQDPDRRFDLHKFITVIRELNQYHINKINFTGGEPTLNMGLLGSALDSIKSHLNEKPYITVNTNGFNYDELRKFNLNCISLSRHHYLDRRNREIFRTDKIPTLKQISANFDPSVLHIRCNLIKGQIDSIEEMEKFINVHAKKGIVDFSFVDLMQVNDFCKDHFVDYKKVNLDNSPKSRVRFSQSREGECSCKNFLYMTERAELVKLYSRFNEDISRCENTLVYDIDHLTMGFSGETII